MHWRGGWRDRRWWTRFARVKPPIVREQNSTLAHRHHEDDLFKSARLALFVCWSLGSSPKHRNLSVEDINVDDLVAYPQGTHRPILRARATSRTTELDQAKNSQNRIPSS
ncbi:hypothetical protein CLAIMM_09138 [Cladophialophora immunda]|nr:hypothetical protein CLAIMM_09138 [Cladophialophora immunda]